MADQIEALKRQLKTLNSTLEKSVKGVNNLVGHLTTAVNLQKEALSVGTSLGSIVDQARTDFRGLRAGTLAPMQIRLSQLVAGFRTNQKGLNELGVQMAFTGQNFRGAMRALADMSAAALLSEEATGDLVGATINLSKVYGIKTEALISALEELSDALDVAGVFGVASEALALQTKLIAQLGPQSQRYVTAALREAMSPDLDSMVRAMRAGVLQQKLAFQQTPTLDTWTAYYDGMLRALNLSTARGTSMDQILSKLLIEARGGKMLLTVARLESLQKRAHSAQTQMQRDLAMYSSSFESMKQEMIGPMVQLLSGAVAVLRGIHDLLGKQGTELLGGGLAGLLGGRLAGAALGGILPRIAGFLGPLGALAGVGFTAYQMLTKDVSDAQEEGNKHLKRIADNTAPKRTIDTTATPIALLARIARDSLRVAIQRSPEARQLALENVQRDMNRNLKEIRDEIKKSNRNLGLPTRSKVNK